MHVVHLTPNFYPAVGGIETYVLELCRRLVKKGHKVSVITSDTMVDGSKLKSFEAIGKINIYRVPFKLIMRYNFSPDAFDLLSKLDYDVLHVHSIGYYTDVIPSIKRIKGVKVIVSTHGGIFHTSHMSLLKKIYFKSFAKRALKHADHVIATSGKDMKLFSKICDGNKIRMIYPGVNWKLLSKSKQHRVKDTLLYVGRLSENKRLDRMLNVIAHVKKRLPDIKLLIVGRDWGEKGGLVRLADMLGIRKNLMFLNEVKNHYKYYSKANIFLLSSDYEGFGTSVVEAMASGMPVVVNNIETMHEIVDSGRSGFVVDFMEYESVADLLIRLLKDETARKDLGKNAGQAAKRFDWDRIESVIEKLYRS